MSFSAQTCLTNTGTTTLGSTILFYSDTDGYNTSFGSTPTSSIIGGNCPFTITGIPNGTTSIKLYDPTSNCCVTIPIQSNDLCITCDLDFTVLSATTVSQIVAGNLTGSCASITDYVVYWYGPNSSTNIGYVSGKGTAFSYNFTHPLTGNSAIFAQAGTYTPVIDKVKINGLTFSQTGGSGNYLANLDCFAPITVNSLNCSNGNQPLGTYTHTFNFSGASQGLPPQPLETTFQLSSTTNYFPFTFQGFSIADRITLLFSGSNYSNFITLEDIVVGSTNGVQYSTFPRSAQTSSQWTRVLTLTGLTRSSNDFITIRVTPNSANTSTNWSFQCSCLETFTCSSCFDNYTNSPYPIIGSSITGISASCNTLYVNFDVSGCSYNDFLNWDIDKYLITGNGFSNFYLPGETFSKTDDVTKKRFRASTLLYNQRRCSAISPGFTTPVCVPITSTTITYEKGISGGIGFFNITCSNYSDFLSFWDGYNSIYNLYSGSPTNNLSLDYYRYAVLRIPTPITNHCGDASTLSQYFFHYSTVVTSGGTGPWTMTLTMPTISNALTFTECDVNCQFFTDDPVDKINLSSTGSSNNITGTTITGSRYTFPFTPSIIITSASTTVSSSTVYASYRLLNISTTQYSFNTLPWSGVSNTYINSQSGQTCNLSGHVYDNTFYQKFQYYYVVNFINPLIDIRDFEIYTSPLVNGGPTGYPSTPYTTILVYRYSGGSVTYSDPTYIV